MALTDLQRMVAGIFTRPQLPTGASMFDQARADAQAQALSQFGMGLVGAAVPQTPLMRAQALQTALGSIGNMGTNVYNAAQARLMSQKAEGEQRRAAALSEFFNQNPTAQTDAAAAVDVGGGFRGPQSNFGSDASVVPGSQLSQVPAAERLVAPKPPSMSIPGGLTESQWSGVQKIAKVDPDKAMEVYGALVKKNTDAPSGFDGSDSLVWVKDEAGNYFQTYVERTAGGTRFVRPEGASGKLSQVSPQEIAGEKAFQTSVKKAAGETKAAAPDAILNADSAINIISSLLNDEEALFSVVGGLEGRVDDPTLLSLRGEKANATVAKITQLKAKGFISAINKTDLKGALSDAEGVKLDTAETALNRVMDDESFKQELLTYKDILERVKLRQQLIIDGMSKEDAIKLVPESPYLASETASTGEGGGAAATSSASPNQPAKISTEEEYNKLPSGTRFVAPDGSIRIKP